MYCVLHPELTPWWSFLYADGARHKKPHSPAHLMTFHKIHHLFCTNFEENLPNTAVSTVPANGLAPQEPGH